jgi:hypothetical protein
MYLKSMFYVPVSQTVPVYPGWHLQTASDIWTAKQLPPFKQCSFWHGPKPNVCENIELIL